MSQQQSARDKNVINLGRPSLRSRLEAYYSLISPDTIANPEQWKSKFDLIYQKFGGSIDGEEKLASKLSKKYGNAVRLVVVTKDCKKGRGTQQYAQQKNQSNALHEEDYYNLKPSQLGSGVLDMISENFDPMAALITSQQAVLKANPWLQNASLLNHVGQCRSLLPSSDPQHLAQAAKTKLKPQSQQKTKKLPAFAAMAELYNKGPLSLLYRCMNQRQRVRVVIRYVNGIRGTLTGYLVAFDKHMNMIMRDVDEVYCPRHVPKDETPQSNVEVELHRRIRAQQSEESTTTTWSVRQRHLKQLLVRGDNVVLVYRAEQEQSVWPPQTNTKSPMGSQHSDNLTLPTQQEQLVGTPGSLVYALQQKKRSMSSSCRKKNYSSR